MQLKSLFGHLLPICLFALSSLTVFSQSTRMALFKRDQDQEKKWNGLRSNQKITVLQYDEAVYEQLRKDDVSKLQIDLPTPDHDLRLNLVKNEIFADGFFVSTDKEKSVNYTGGLHYKGQIEGQPGSIVAISFFDNEVIAVINETDGNKYVVGQSSALRRGSFAVYNAAEVDAPAIGCLSESLPGYSDYVNQIKMPTVLEQRAAGGCVNIYFELGLSVFNNKGGTAGATNYITGAFNTVSALYAADGVTVKISQVFVWTTAEPYADDASSALTQFGQAKKLNFNGNLAQLVRLKTGGSMSGIAWVNVLCSAASSSGAGPFSYAEILPTVSSLPTFSWTAEVITHELGHNLGSPHTQSCSWTGGPIDNCVAQEGSCAPGPTPVGGGTIMSYCHLTSIGINFSYGFGPQPKALILSRISASSCIVACSTGGSCVSPTGLTTSSITTSGATLSWTPVTGAVNYTVDYKPSISSTWTSVNSVGTASSVVLTGLSAGTLYNWQVKTNCATGSSASTQSQLTTSGTTINCTTNPPGGLVTTGISSTIATTSWSASTGASSYTYYIRTANDPTWYLLSANFTTVSAYLTNLVPGTTYVWKISANCSAGSSAYTEGQFTTLTSSNCTSSPPTGLSTTSISSISAILNWNIVSTATTYAVQYKLRTSATWITLIANTTSTSISLTGLLSGQLYDWQVRSNCSAGSSAFAASSFTSSAATSCASPVTLTTTNITGTTCTVNWSSVSGAFNYTLEMKLASDVNWSQLTVTSATAVNISGLTAGYIYNWRVKTNCSGSSSGYTQTQFTTTGTLPVSCNAPTSLTSSTITTASAALAWVAVSGALNYSVEYKVNTSSQWVVANASLAATTFLLSNLTSSTIYDWRIKTNCSSASSAYTTAQFTTGTVSNACPGTLDLTENGTIATAKPAPFNTDIKGQINPSGDIDYYSFVISAGGTITISLTTLPADFDLRIYNSTGTTSLGVSQNGGTISESITTSLSPGTYYIRVYGWSGATSSNCYTLRLQPSTASIEYKAGIYYNPDVLTTSVFPNPATTSLNYRILGLTGPAELTVTDLQGRNIMTTYTKESVSQLNVSTLSAGFYFLKVRDENNRSNVVKFMKTL